MAAIKLWTRHDECVLVIDVYTSVKQNLRFFVYDPSQPNTVLIDKTQLVDGKYTYAARCPLTGNFSIVEVVSEDGMPESTFKILKVDRRELEKRIDLVDMTPSLNSFVSFAQKFAYNIGVLNTNTVYNSLNGKYHIRYFDEILDYKTGKPVDTPYRISLQDGTIEANKKLIIEYTVPMNILLLLHEYSHFFKNEDIDNELEADLNGLSIYLALGYPRYEALIAFAKTFDHNDTPENEERWNIIREFIENFEKQNYIFHD